MNNVDIFRYRALRGNLILVLAIVCVAISGCYGPQEIDATYGRRRGYPAVSSVNGTEVLSRVFEDAGYRVSSTSRLAKSVDQAQVVVWVPDAFKLPESNICDHLDNWLAAEENRTLVYVARDYDAAVEYYRSIVEQGSAPNIENYQRGLAEHHLSFELRRNGYHPDDPLTMMPIQGEVVSETQTGPWFTLQREVRRQRITRLDGPWSKNIDASKTNIVVWSKLVAVNDSEVTETGDAADTESPTGSENDAVEAEAPEIEQEDPTENEQLEGPAPVAENPIPADVDEPSVESELESDTDTDTDTDTENTEDESEEYEWLVWGGRLIVTPLLIGDDERVLALEIRRPYWNGSRIVVIINGSWLLNLPLVNHEHRKLAGELIASCGRPGKAVFLESDERGARISKGSDNPFWSLLKQRPLGAILMHLFALGMLYCFAMFPIFGPARSLTRETITDFGKHVIALGKRMATTRNAQYARGRLHAYQQFVRRDSGVSHVKDTAK